MGPNKRKCLEHDEILSHISNFIDMMEMHLKLILNLLFGWKFRNIIEFTILMRTYYWDENSSMCDEK